MVSDTKPRTRIIIIAIVCIVALCLSFVFPVNAKLVMTPSTHEKIEYLTVENSRLTGDRFLRFALHDEESKYLQLCFSVPKEDAALLDGNIVDLRIDDKTIGEYSVITHSTWRRRYVMFLIGDVTSFSKISFSYDNQTVNTA